MSLHDITHADLHLGNVGIQNYDSLENMKIVIYDFGQCFDLSSIDIKIRKRLIESFLKQQFYEFVAFLPQQDREQLMKRSTGVFVNDLRILGSYILMNTVHVNLCITNAIIAWGKTKGIAEIIHAQCEKSERFDTIPFLIENGVKQYIDKYLPYDEFDCLREL